MSGRDISRPRRVVARGCYAVLSWTVACTSTTVPIAPAAPARTATTSAAPRKEPIAAASSVPPTAEPPRSIPPLLAAGSPAGTFGGAGPVLVNRSAPDGSWLAWCEAREDTNGDGQLRVNVDLQGNVGGDRLDGYFAMEGGMGRPYDAWVSSSRDGRYVALLAQGKLVVLDTRERSELDLTALGGKQQTDTSPYLDHRAATFSPIAPMVLFYRDTPEGEQVVLRNLVTGEETTYAEPEGKLWRVDFDGSGNYLIAKVVDTDTNKNGKLDLPFPLAPLNAGATRLRGCASPIPTFTVRRYPGDEPVPFIARLGAESWLRVPGLVRPLGDELLVRDEDGSLHILNATEKRLLVNDKCDARILHVDAARRKVIAACLGSKKRGEVVILGGTERIPLNFRVASFELDRWLEGSPKLVPLYPGQSTVLVDMDTLKVSSLRDQDRVLATENDTALIRRKNTLLSLTGAGDPTELAASLTSFSAVERQGDMIAVAPYVVDARTHTVVGRFPGEALAVATDGRVLEIQGSPGDVDHVATGPLVWLTPEPLSN